MRKYQRDDYTPWSFVVPIALAVMIGVLAADLVRLMVAAAMAKKAMAELNESLRHQTTPGHLPARQASAASAAVPVYSYETRSSVARLPGLLRANKEGIDKACIGGTISNRESNGWSQDISSGRPEPCIATSSD